MYICADVFAPYAGPRRPGGVVRYRDALIEACLLVREYFSLGLRQMEGFVRSLADVMGITEAVPEYTTVCRRSRRLKVRLDPRLKQKAGTEGYVIAVDSTGLSLITSDSWNRYKHRAKRGNASWHKVHVAINTDTGDILACADTSATTNDCQVLPTLIEALPSDVLRTVRAVCADMAYDTVRCRRAITQMGAIPRIPPKRGAVLTSERKHPLAPSDARALSSRDDAIAYIRTNAINGDDGLARKQYKVLTGYHRRSLVETTMSQIKVHTGSTLKSKTPETQKTECRLKCKVLNLLNRA